MLNREWMRRLVISLLCMAWISSCSRQGLLPSPIRGRSADLSKDASGVVVPGATVVLTNEGTGEAHQANSGCTGPLHRYQFD